MKKHLTLTILFYRKTIILSNFFSLQISGKGTGKNQTTDDERIGM
jgi:hypothetical protein